jgi:hypothetical protein
MQNDLGCSTFPREDLDEAVRFLGPEWTVEEWEDRQRQRELRRFVPHSEPSTAPESPDPAVAAKQIMQGIK